MKRLMKAAFGCLASAVMLLGSIPVSVIAEATYSKKDTIDLCVEIVTGEEAEKYTVKASRQSKGTASVEAGDYCVTARIHNNSGFALSGFRILFDLENFEPVSYTREEKGVLNEYPVYYVGEDVNLGRNFSINRNEDNDEQSCLGWGTMGTENMEEDGRVFSFFFRRKPDSDPKAVVPVTSASIVQWFNADRKKITCNLVNSGCYFRETASCGDVDANGIVDNIDAQIMLEIATEMMTLGENLKDFELFDTYEAEIDENTAANIQISWLTDIGDVTDDGLLDVIDAQDILNYYANCILAGNPPADSVGSSVSGYRFIQY